MIENNYAKAYKEVIEILEYVPKENLEQIPKDIIEMFELKMDKSYEFKIDINKSFEEQNLLQETRVILANIFKDYWASDYQKEKIEKKKQCDIKMREEEKKKYNVNNIFDNRYINEKKEITEIIVKKEAFYHKLINFIKRWLHIN